MKRAILLLILATTCFFVNAQKQVIYLPTQNGVEVTNVEDYRWVYATSAGCNVQIGPQTRVITATIPFSQIRDSLGRNFAQVTQRYFVGGTPSTRSALVQLKSIRNIITKSGYTTIQIRNPDQEYQVTESLQDVIDLVSFPVGDGSGVTGGGVTGDTIYIINDGGVSPPDTFFIAIPGGSGGNGIFGVPDAVPAGMVATIDSGITFQGLQPTTFFNVDMDQGLYGTDYTQNDDTLKFRFYDLGSDSWIVVDANGIDIHSDGPDKIFLDGAVRVTDLVTDPATKLVGTDADGDLSSLVLGTNLSISNDTLNAASPPPGLTGTGLPTRIAAWTASGALGYDVGMVLDTVNNRMGVNTQAPTATLHVTGTASGNNSKGAFINSTLTATANNDNYAALQVEGTFVPGAFTSTRPYIAAFVGSAASPSWKPYIAITEGRSVTPPTIRWYRNSNNTLSTGTLRMTLAGNAVGNNTSTFSDVNDAEGLQFATGTSQTLVQATLTGTGDRMPLATLQTKTATRYRGVLFCEELVIGSDEDASSAAIGGILRTGQKNSAGTNAWGANLTIQAGRGTGNATTGGNIIFQTPDVQASGTTLQTYATAMQIVRTTRNVLIGHTTDAVASLDVNSAGSTSATDAANFANSLDSTILRVRSDRRVGINTATPDVSLDAGENTDGIKLPAGTTAQRAAVNNSIRYNSDVEGFEARENGVWFRLTSSQAPSIAAGAAAGTGPTVAIGAGSNDLGGTIEITTGTSTTTGTLATITYGDAFDASLLPHVTVTPANDKAAKHMLQWYKGTAGNTSFVLTSRVALDASTLYVFTYQVQQ